MENNSLEADLDQARRPKGSASDRWREIVHRQRQSELGPAAFCRAEGIPQSSFFGWRRKLAGRTKAGKAASVGAAKIPAIGFAPVTVKAEAAWEIAASRGRDAALELRLAGRRRVIVRDGFDPDLLARVVRVLESLDTRARGIGGAS